MKKILAFILLAFLIVSLVACNSTSTPVDITDDILGQSDEGKMTLSSYRGNEKNIKIPDYLEGERVCSIEQSFAEGKEFESVVLPGRIQGCYRDENGKFVLTTWVEDGVVPINEKTAPWIYCAFFGVSSIKVNEKEYSCDTVNAVTDEMIVGEWHMKGDVLYTFTADNKIIMSDGTVSYEGTWERMDSSVTLHMDADFDNNDIVIEYCDGCLVSWASNATLYRGEVPEDPHYEEPSGSNGGSFGSIASGDYTYEERDGGICLLAYTGTDTVVHIPEALDGKTVTALDMSANDTIKELHIPSTVKTVYEIRQTVGLEIIYWSDVESTELIAGLRQCYDLKELHLPGLSSVNLNDFPLIYIERLTLLDISDCKEVIGTSHIRVDEVRVSEDIKYVQIPEMGTGIEVLTATKTERSIEITDESWEEAWGLIFPLDIGLKKINGVAYSGGQPLMFDDGWWSGYSANGESNEKVLYINERGFSYIAEASEADRENPEQTMTKFEIGIGYNWWFFDNQLWDLENNCYYLPEK